MHDPFRRPNLRRTARRSALFLALLCALAAWPPVRAQSDPVLERLAQMTTAEKVGQLFVIAFWGRNPSPPSRAGKLIQESNIGGVVLLSSNLNLVNQGTDTLADVTRLNNALQGMAMAKAGPGIPLFIAIDHEGDGYPLTRITNGTTPLPNPMTVGATWDTQSARQVGEIAGRELSALGINMLLGPVVDVLDDPRPGGRGDIGTRAFGGDPYWVSEMGRAYIHGVHAGSEGKVLTVAKHFPGHGGSDRLPDDEVATVDKSLQELRRVDLAPFFAVTNPRDPDGLERTDAMMSSHIRYRGFYGDIRQLTRPISFDAESMRALLDLPEFREWRREGLMVSDSLGVRAVRKYFDPQLRTFPHRQIAREAFLAGNDLLVLSEFALEASWEQQYDNIVEVIAYFHETYDSDPAFAARVDQAVTRILRQKLKLYPDFDPAAVRTDPAGAEAIGQAQSLAHIDAIVRRGATVLQPTVDSLPRPPRQDEDILVVVEERSVRECFDALPECEPHPLIPPASIEETILRLYGPEGSGQVDPARIHTRTYAQLKAYLTQREGDAGPLLEGAEWIVFGMLDPNPRYPDADALQLFLAQNAHQIYDANVIVLAYTAPYYLDATEISKLTAYYVFYGKTPPYVETSVRTLFGEVRPQGRSPVSIEGTYYDLNSQLGPDPEQRIRLEQIEPTGAAAVIPFTLSVRTNLIRDHNGNPVPDGTLVDFLARNAESEQILDAALYLTVNGVAEAQMSVTRPGRVVVVAQSGDAPESLPLFFDALPEPTPTAAPATPAPTATRTPTATPTATATREQAASPTPIDTPAPQATPAPGPAFSSALLDTWQGKPRDLLGGLAGILIAVLAVLPWQRTAPPHRRMRSLLAAWTGGVAGYLAYGWQWIPSERWVDWPAWIGGGVVSLAGGLLLEVLTGLAARSQITLAE